MKLHQPILLLTLGLATALTLLTDATPVDTNNNFASHSQQDNHAAVLAASNPSRQSSSRAATTVSRRASLRRRRSSTSRASLQLATTTSREAESKDLRASVHLLEFPSPSTLVPRRQREQQRQERRRRLSGLSSTMSDVFPAGDTETQTQATESKIESNGSKMPRNALTQTEDSLSPAPTTTNHDDKNVDALLDAHTLLLPAQDGSDAASDAGVVGQTQTQKQKQQQPVPSTSTPMSLGRKRLSKRAVPEIPPARTYKQQQQQPSVPTTTPLLLLPDSNSVWQTGTFQTVQWSKHYAKSLPKDTTVDIVLVEARTNQKIFSLKRFIPFRRGGAQVWVPLQVPEGVSFVLVLELYHGRSQEQVSTVVASSTSSSSSTQESAQDRSRSGTLNSVPLATSPRLVRRSDISISSHHRRAAAPAAADAFAQDVNDPNTQNRNTNNNNNSRQPGSFNKYAGAGAAAVAQQQEDSLSPLRPKSNEPGTHHDINDNDYYIGASEERPFEFLPDELRQEYPGTVKPLELEHILGVHQLVYTLTPYTLEWRTPERVQELLDYSAQVQKALGLYIQRHPRDPVPPTTLLPKSLFLSKVKVELIKDDTTEVIAVLAKDVPTETMFQYVSIQDRVPTAFYRLRVQMVVVQIHLDPETIKNAILQQRPTQLQLGDASSFNSESGAWLSSVLDVGKAKPMEGWEFPAGGEVIDRYEAITRRFFVSQGALNTIP